MEPGTACPELFGKEKTCTTAKRTVLIVHAQR
jgi:hypothetical protein